MCTTGRNTFGNSFKPIITCYRSTVMKYFPKHLVLQFADNTWIQNLVLKKHGFLSFSDKLNPKSLSYDQKEYYYTQIHQHCKQGSGDLVAPNPDKQ